MTAQLPSEIPLLERGIRLDLLSVKGFSSGTFPGVVCCSSSLSPFIPTCAPPKFENQSCKTNFSPLDWVRAHHLFLLPAFL